MGDVAADRIDSLKEHSSSESEAVNSGTVGSHGGARPGAGRRPGSMNKKTLERMAQKRRLVQRIVANTDKIFNAQLDKAIGEKYLMVKITEYATKKDGSRGAIKRQYHEIVTDPHVIIAYLDGELDGGEPIHDDEHYYYMTTKPADNLAAANLLDRAYGKPTEKVELGGADDGDLSELDDNELNKRIDAYLEQRRKQSGR